MTELTDDRPSREITFAELVAARADDDRTGLCFQDASWTWREIIEEARRRAALARSARGHVGLFLENGPEHLFWLLGLSLTGAAAVELNPTRRGAELARDITHTDCRLLVTEPSRAELLEGLVTLPSLTVDTPAYRSTLDKTRPAEIAPVDPRTIFSLVFTSGTTSAPKAVICTQGRLGRIAVQQRDRRALTRDDVFYVVMPMFHSNALMAGTAPASALREGAGGESRVGAWCSGAPDALVHRHRRLAAACVRYIDGARNADLSPGSPDLPGVLDALSRLGGPGGALPNVDVNLQGLQKAADWLLGRDLPGPWWDMYAEALEGFSLESLTGETLLHYDLHRGNLLIAGRETYVIDWSFACRGRAWIDAALLIPRLIEAGHSPAQAEALVMTQWRTVPDDAVTGLGALWTMFREYKAMHGPEDGRGFRGRAARAGRAWITYRTR